MNKVTCFLIIFVVSSAFAQDVPPPPKPADDGPSLEVTMKYIQDRLNGQGKVSYQTDWTGRGDEFDPNTIFGRSESITLSNAVAEAAGCTLSFTLQGNTIYSNGTSAFEVVEKLSIRDVDRLVVESKQESDNRRSAPVGLHEEIDPFISIVRIVVSSGKRIYYHARGTDLKGITRENDDPETRTETDLLFLEEDAAQRMAKAIVHAVELCGGGKDDKDLFK